MNGIQSANTIANSIISDAERVIKAKARKSKPTKSWYKLTKEQRKYSKAVDRYRSLVGRFRLTQEEKVALKEFTPKQVQRRFETWTVKKHERRETLFMKRYGEAFVKKYGMDRNTYERATYILEFLAPKSAARRLGLDIEEPTEKELTAKEWKEFTVPVWPRVSWAQLPAEFTHNAHDWEHTFGSFIYENAEILWVGGSYTPIDIGKLFDYGQDGYDHHLSDFFKTFGAFISDFAREPILYNPGGEGHFAVYAREWEDVEELAEDYETSRRYIAKGDK